MTTTRVQDVFILTPPCRGDFRLPASSPRSSRGCFVKLLCAVDPAAQNGFGFEGRIYRPGQQITAAEMRPSLKYPIVPVVLEYCFMLAYGAAGRRRRDSLYILWHWDPQQSMWRELGRAASASWEWALALRPLALGALSESPSDVAGEQPVDHVAIEQRISAFLDGEIGPLSVSDRSRVLGMLHDQLAGRMCA